MKRLLVLFLTIIFPIPVLFIFLTPLAAAENNTFTVNTAADVDDVTPGDGFCDSDPVTVGEQCTLRAAVSEANASTNAVTVTIPAGTYTLTQTGNLEDNNATGDLDIAGNLHLMGDGREATIIQAGETLSDSVDRVFHVLNTAADVSFSSLTIQHGYVANSETLDGQIDDGAGILVVGNPETAVIVRDVLITHNHNDDLREDGGGIANLGGGTVYIYDSFIISNSVRMEVGSSGGGLFTVFGSDMVIDNSVISGNVAGGKGGGMYSNRDGATIRLSNSTVSHNYSADVGGGIQSGAFVYITNTTISNNHTDLTGGGLSSDSPDSQIVLNHVTIAQNTADFDDDGNGGGGGIHLISGTISISNSIIADNTRGDGTADDCDVDSSLNGSYSLIKTMTNCALTGTNNITNSDPLLLGLTVAGWHPLADSSPALDLVPAGVNGCGTQVTADQRKAPRPFGDGCDAGAYERVQFALTVAVEGEGVVTSIPSGISCGVSCTALFDYGEAVTLVATAAEDFRLASWDGACVGTGACVVIMSDHQTVSARFVVAQYATYLPFVGR